MSVRVQFGMEPNIGVISCGYLADAEFIRTRASYMGEVSYQQERVLNPGDSYEIVKTITLPQGTDGDYYLHIHLNAHNDRDPRVRRWDSRILLTDWWPAASGKNDDWLSHFERWAYESPFNNLHTAAFPIEYREPDLDITSLIIPENANSGETIPITFTVQNVGNRATRTSSWTDRLFISHDASLDSQDFQLAAIGRSEILQPGESYTVTQDVKLPEAIGGTFNILAYADSAAYRDPYGRVKSDVGFFNPGTLFEADNPLEPWDMASNAARQSRGRVFEFQQESNNIANADLPVSLVNPPDLQVTDLVAPFRVDRGQLIDVFFTVSNEGGDTVPGQNSWSDLVYLSRDPVLDLSADRYIGNLERKGGLEAGQSYNQSLQFQVPTDLVGPWYLIVVTDPIQRGQIGNVFEGPGEQNNATASTQPMVIQLPPPSDLVVSAISPPLTAQPGEVSKSNLHFYF